MEIDPEGLIGRYLFDEIVDKETGEVLVETNQAITEEILDLIYKNQISAGGDSRKVPEPGASKPWCAVHAA